MARQNALRPQITTLPTDATGMVQPVDVMHMIPTAKQAKESRAKRNRPWDAKNPVISYRIPANLHAKAKDIRFVVKKAAGRYMTSISSVAAAFMAFSLSHLRSGKLVIEPRPNPERRTLTLHWSEAESGWPQDIKPVNERKKENIRAVVKPVFLGYRYGTDVDQQIRAISKQTGVPSGEVVVFLLSHAIEAYGKGQLILTPESVVVTNKVSPSWDAEK